MTTHLAAISHEKGTPLRVSSLPTPSPGPHDLLIAVRAIAVNPIDYYQRDNAFPPINHPAVLGSDISGEVIGAGTAVPSSAPRIGDRVTAFAPTFFKKGEEKYGGFQERVLVPAVNAARLPDDVGWVDGAVLPMAVATAWAGLALVGAEKDMNFKEEESRGLLVWGGASSIGSAAVQIGKIVGLRVYVTASEKHHEYLRSLGASKCFEYKNEDVVREIVKAAAEDGVVLDRCFDAIGEVAKCSAVLKEARGNGLGRLASAKPLSGEEEKVEGVELVFVSAPDGEEERNKHFQFIFNTWLKEKLATGDFVPSPQAEVIPGGLRAINEALDKLRQGVSGVKLVVEV